MEITAARRSFRGWAGNRSQQHSSNIQTRILQWPAPPPQSTAARHRIATAGALGASGGETALPAPTRIRADREHYRDPYECDRAGAERKQLIEDWSAWGRRGLTPPCRMFGTSRGTWHKRAKRFRASGYPDRLGGCQGVTNRVGLALSAQHHAHREILVSQGPIAKRPPRLPGEVNSLESKSAIPRQRRNRRMPAHPLRSSSIHTVPRQFRCFIRSVDSKSGSIYTQTRFRRSLARN